MKMYFSKQAFIHEHSLLSSRLHPQASSPIEYKQVSSRESISFQVSRALNPLMIQLWVQVFLLSCCPKLESKFARSSSRESWSQQHLASVAPGCPSRWRTLKAAQPTCRCRQGDPTLDLLVLEPGVCQPESWQSDTGTVSLLHLPHLRGEFFHVLLHIWYLVNTWEESVNGGEPEEASNSSLLLLLWETLLQPFSLRLVPVWDHLQQGLHCCLGDETLPSGPGEVVGY